MFVLPMMATHYMAYSLNKAAGEYLRRQKENGGKRDGN